MKYSKQNGSNRDYKAIEPKLKQYKMPIVRKFI